MYRPGAPVGQPPPMINRGAPGQPQWTPMPMSPQPRRSNAIWWILGGLAVIVVLGIGGVIVLLAIASMSSSQSNNNNNRGVLGNSNTANRNANNWQANANPSNTNSSVNLPAYFSDDFSSQKWSTGNSPFGDLWYANNEYHMKSKVKTYFVIDGPSNDYNTENARIRVTVHNVDGTSPAAGYGLVVHCDRSKALEDYGFLIYTGETPKYEVVLHKGGAQTELIPWTAANIIRPGTSSNQLEVRIKGAQLSFYINGQLATSITDSANYKRGRAGFYASDAHEVAFDDLQISR
jgi:type II secretory pathway pseudopilin PulG